ELIEELGEGGMAMVYAALDHQRDKRKVAVKFPHPRIYDTEKAPERFGREMQVLKKLRHPNIVGYLDHGIDESMGVPFFVMEYFHGKTLAELIEERRAAAKGAHIGVSLIRQPFFSEIVEQSLLGVEAVHKKGFVHRDIKPLNIFCRLENGHMIVKLSDFGIVKVLDDCESETLCAGNQLTEEWVMLGTPEYLSPEQLNSRDIDSRSDLYALGTVFYEMVTGKPTIQVRKMRQMQYLYELQEPLAESKHPSRFAGGMDKELEKWILALLEKNPENRIQTAGEALQRFREIMKKERVSVPSLQTKPAPKARESVASRPGAESPPASQAQPKPAAKDPKGIAYFNYVFLAVLAVIVAVIAARWLHGSDETATIAKDSRATASGSTKLAMSAPANTPAQVEASPTAVVLTAADELPPPDRRRFDNADKNFQRLPKHFPCGQGIKMDLLYITAKYPNFPNPQYRVAECFAREKNAKKAETFFKQYEALTGGREPPK
ncbi:protein kinase, partial [Patescibacteria group bacterium]|nr:protein kinase [Patescibacteria group bacterium]MBU1630059.1 protein kinase [Patescibacteria group bacterium]